ncbi:hypothetical protein TYRP_017021 [Tyrophagus putrescentiae]|nr:hypothetical protein TYRP_017021 [Tyrophagus putrescentiae]
MQNNGGQIRVKLCRVCGTKASGFNYGGLSSHEQQVVTELQTALSASFEDETKLELVGNVTEVKTAFNLTSLYARRIIKFCKSMPPFKILKEADQFTILKSFYLKILMIRIAFIWDVEKQGYPVIEDESGRRALFMSSSLGQKMKCQDIVEYNIRQTNRMHAALESDLVIRDLLIAQALFTPIPTLSSLEFVRYHYTVFKRILFKYVQIKYRGNQRKAQQKFFALQGILKEFDTILRNSERLFKSEFPDLNEANEIMGELFNLM